MYRAAERRLLELAAEGAHDAASGIIRHHQQSLYAYMLRMSGLSLIQISEPTRPD